MTEPVSNKRGRGRPKSPHAKKAISLRLSPDILAKYRESGKGWQSRINADLRKAAGLPPRDA